MTCSRPATFLASVVPIALQDAAATFLIGFLPVQRHQSHQIRAEFAMNRVRSPAIRLDDLLKARGSGVEQVRRSDLEACVSAGTPNDERECRHIETQNDGSK